MKQYKDTVAITLTADATGAIDQIDTSDFDDGLLGSIYADLIHYWYLSSPYCPAAELRAYEERNGLFDNQLVLPTAFGGISELVYDRNLDGSESVPRHEFIASGIDFLTSSIPFIEMVLRQRPDLVLELVGVEIHYGPESCRLIATLMFN